MVNYWGRQQVYDVLIAALATAITIGAPSIGFTPLINLTAENLVLSARAWVGPALTLLGMMSATTAFIFSVVDRGEFRPLRELGVEPQLWGVFSENILWLAVAAVSAMLISFWHVTSVTTLLLAAVTFLFFMVVICLAKFAWVMRQVISVRASK